jgi:hypothetical protein
MTPEFWNNQFLQISRQGFQECRKPDNLHIQYNLGGYLGNNFDQTTSLK